jgi:hypothetical protein
MANELIKLTSPTTYTQVTAGNTGDILIQKTGGDVGFLADPTSWALYADSTYTDVSPLSINNAKVQIACDGLGGTTNKTQLSPNIAITDLWDAVTNRITPVNIGDAYSLRLTFDAQGPQNAYFDIGLDISSDIINSPIVIARETKIHPEGTGVTSGYSFDVPIFSLSTFTTNGGALFIDTRDDAIQLDIFNINIFLCRVHRAIGQEV